MDHSVFENSLDEKTQINTIFLLLGANLGEPKTQIARALACIEDSMGPIAKQSSLYSSEAWGVEDQPVFFNQVVEVCSTLTPAEVLKTAQHIENKLGRIRKVKWGARLIDIDILYYNEGIIHEDNLQIPHPYIQERNFTLVPLVEIAPDFVHPKLQKSNKELLSLTADTLKVQIEHD